MLKFSAGIVGWPFPLSPLLIPRYILLPLG